MFLGTTPKEVCQYLASIIEKENPKRVFVPFAGNFVVEQVVAKLEKEIKVISGDVSLYSNAIGFAITNQKSDIKLKEELLKDFPYFKNKTTPIDIAAQVIFFSEVAQARAKAEKIRYYKSIYEDAVKNQEKYIEIILEKIKKVKKTLSNIEYSALDAGVLIQSAKKDDVLYYDSPTIKGGYESMFKCLCECFTFKETEYSIIDNEVRKEHMKMLHKKGVKVLMNAYYPDNNIEVLPDGYEESFRYKYKDNRYISIYSNIKNKKWVNIKETLKEKQSKYEIINEEDEITNKSRIEFVKCPQDVAAHYRIMWVKKANIKNGGTNYLVFIDKKLIGCVVMTSGLMFSSELAVIFSDPVTQTSKYNKLAKLLIYMICSKPFLKMYNDETLWEHTGVTTAVFTNYEKSMKYRGLFNVKEKKVIKEGRYKYKIIYQNKDKIFPTYKAALTQWLDKHKNDIK